MTFNQESAHATRWQYSPEGWERRRHFADLLGEACAERAVALEWTSPELWTGIMTREDDEAHLAGYVFPLNNATAARITNDKADTFNVLQRRGVDAVPHYLVSPYKADGTRQSLQEMTEQTLEKAGLPVVVKPNADVSGGGGIAICDTPEQVEHAISDITERYGPAAVSPFIEFDEFRTIVLDGEPLLTYQKHRAPGELLHNLGKGATPEILGASPFKNTVESLAVDSLAAVRGRFASVDVVSTSAGQQMTLEINDGVALGYFGRLHRERSKEIYGKAVEASLVA